MIIILIAIGSIVIGAFAGYWHGYSSAERVWRQREAILGEMMKPLKLGDGETIRWRQRDDK